MQQLLTSQRGYIMSSRCVASSAFRFGAEQIVLLKKCSKKSLCRTISFEEECRRTAQQRGRISLLFLPEKLFLQLVRVRRERESTLQAAQIPVCVAAAVPLRASAQDFDCGAAEFRRLWISSAQNCAFMCVSTYFFYFFLLLFWYVYVCNDYVRQKNTFGHWISLH